MFSELFWILRRNSLVLIPSSQIRQEGRHAGPGGDIDQIVESVMKKRPDLSIQTTSVLAGEAAFWNSLVSTNHQEFSPDGHFEVLSGCFIQGRSAKWSGSRFRPAPWLHLSTPLPIHSTCQATVCWRNCCWSGLSKASPCGCFTEVCCWQILYGQRNIQRNITLEHPNSNTPFLRCF